jgi:hypothetical protein
LETKKGKTKQKEHFINALPRQPTAGRGKSRMQKAAPKRKANLKKKTQKAAKNEFVHYVLKERKKE